LLIVITTSCAPILGVEETRYEAAEGECTLMPTRVFFADKLDENTQITVGAVTQAELSELAIDVGTTLSPDRGHALASILDCDGNPIEDAELDIEPTPNSETRFVIDGAGVQLGTDTSSLGLAGAFNLPATASSSFGRCRPKSPPIRAVSATSCPSPASSASSCFGRTAISRLPRWRHLRRSRAWERRPRP
jgi:hypothetical protein